jgi:hypothetical protein
MYTDYSLLDATASEQLAAEAQAGGPTTGTTRIVSGPAGSWSGNADCHYIHSTPTSGNKPMHTQQQKKSTEQMPIPSFLHSSSERMLWPVGLQLVPDLIKMGLVATVLTPTNLIAMGLVATDLIAADLILTMWTY